MLPSSLYGTLLSQMSPPGSVKDILSILGMNINDVITSTSDAEVSAPFDKSYQSFLQTAHGVNPKLEKPALPERDDGLTYAQWYFKVIGPYLPVLHKASFMQLVSLI